MTTFETGKIYYRRFLLVERFIIKRRTRCYVWFNELGRTRIIKKKIRYDIDRNEYFRSVEDNQVAQVVWADQKWDSSWRVGKNENGCEIIIKPDYKKYEKMNTATFKMFKYVVSMWGMGQVLWFDDDNVIDYEYLVKEMVKENTEDFDEDYYCLYYTSNKDINWDMINILMYRSYQFNVSEI